MPFKAATAAIFDDPNFGESAKYFPKRGPETAVTVVMSRPDKQVDVGVAGINVPSWAADIKKSQLPVTAAKGDSLVVGSETFIVRRIELEALRLIARLDLDLV